MIFKIAVGIGIVFIGTRISQTFNNLVQTAEGFHTGIAGPLGYFQARGFVRRGVSEDGLTGEPCGRGDSEHNASADCLRKGTKKFLFVLLRSQPMERNIPGVAVVQKFRVATAEIKTAQKCVIEFFFDPFRTYIR